MANEMHVVVVGGGSAGLGAAVALAKLRRGDLQLRITLVDPKEHFEVRWAAVRAWFDERIRKEMIVTYESLLSKHSIDHERDSCAAVNDTSVTLESGKVLEFDVCLFAVGARCPTKGVDLEGPETFDIAGRSAQLDEIGKSFIGQSAVVVGGGTLGCEVAGELVGRAGKVTVVQSPETVVPEMRPGAQRTVHRRMSEMGIEIHVGHRAVQDGGKWTTQPKGEGKEGIDLGVVDTLIKCTGYSPRNEALSAGNLEKPLDAKGWADSDDYFRLSGGGGRIFAFGDCCNTGDQTVMTIYPNCAVVARNIMATLRCLKDEQPLENMKCCKLRKAKGKPVNMIVLTLGPDNGVADTPLGSFESVLPPFKNKTLFIDNALSYVS